MSDKTDLKSEAAMIAEFMGLERTKEIWDKDEHAYTMKFPGMFWNQWVIPSHMHFKDSWDWLMPVVEKIRKVTIPEKRKGMPEHSANRGELIDVDLSCAFMEVSLEKVYKHTVEYIRWYNSNKVTSTMTDKP